MRVNELNNDGIVKSEEKIETDLVQRNNESCSLKHKSESASETRRFLSIP